MAKDRKARFTHAVAVLIDRDAADRYGPWLDSLLLGLVDEGISPMLVGPPGVELAGGIPEHLLARMILTRSRLPLLRRFIVQPVIARLADEPVRMVLAASGRLADLGARFAAALHVPLAVIVMGEDEVAPAASAGPALQTVFAGSESLADRVRKRLSAADEKAVQQVSLGVHMHEGIAAFAGERTRGIIGLGSADPGSLDQLLAAFSHLSDRGYDAVYFVMGSGSAERRIRRSAQARRLGDRFTLVPDLKRMDRLWPGIDVLVQPEVNRHLDLRLLEAMAAGVAVVARNGGAMNLMADGVNGVELTQGDEAEMTMVLQRLLDEPELGRNIGRNARDYVQSHHLAGVTVAQITRTIRFAVVAQVTIRMNEAEPPTAPAE
ncbi:MAG: hypothetical protein BIFFINMI_00429 [Phycisphaerae bacterium]|nr:hypothetical protein [Phycisphaerae bacterium]